MSGKKWNLAVQATVMLLFFPLPLSVVAQSLPAGDDPGQMNKRFDEPRAPLSQPRTMLRLQSSIPPQDAEQAHLVLQDVNIDGSTVFSSDDFVSLYSHLIGKEISVKAIYGIAEKITAKYGDAGYALSRAIIPPQEFDKRFSVIRIQIIEGFIDRVVWPEEVGKFRDFFAYYEAQITAQRPITVRHMERYLLLANELPGLTFKSTLTPSEANPGASTMVMALTKDDAEGALLLDNRGTESSGPYDATVSGALNNGMRQHEKVTLGYTIAGPSDNHDAPELHYGSVAYGQVLTAEGLRFDLSGNRSWVRPGTQTLRDLNYDSNGINVSASLQYPFIRTREETLLGLMAFDLNNSESELLENSNTNDRLRIFRGELSYDRLDTWFGDEHTGINQIILTPSLGVNGLGSTDNDNPLATRSNGRVDFKKLEIEVARTQMLAADWSLYGNVYTQLTRDPLLSSQECGYGGTKYGRGFEPSIIVGDQCFLVLGELRYNVSLPEDFVQTLESVQVYAVADFGRVWNIAAPAGTVSQNEASSAGIGVRVSSRQRVSADISVMKTLSEPNGVENPRDWNAYFRASLKF